MVEQGQAVIAFRSPSRRSGYAELPTVVILDDGLSDAAVRLYSLLVSYAIQSDGCIVNQKSIAEDLARSTRAVQRGLSELSERKLLTIQRQGLTQPNIYWLENPYAAYDSRTPRRKSSKPAAANDKSVVSDATDLSHQEVTEMASQETTESSHPLKKDLRKNLGKNKIQTLNVEEAVNFVSPEESPAKEKKRNLRAAVLDNLTAALVQELGDLGSERRHRQLLDICERNGLDELAKQALLATRRRLAQEQEQGVLEKPGAYYQKILISLLEDYQVFVPPAGSKDEQDQVKQLVQASLAQSNLQDRPFKLP